MKPFLLLGGLLLAAALVAAFRPATPNPQGRAPKFEASEVINAQPTRFDRQPLTLVSFWTFGCSNCRWNLPIYADWQAKFKSRGFKVVSVHTPELKSERDVANVRREVKSLGITYPVLIDGDMKNWKAWGVHYWPTFFLVDQKGLIRAKGEGEIHGDKSSWENQIDQLLKEAGR